MTSTSSLHAPEFWSKVPPVTAAFWVIKIMSTTVGETAADYLTVNLGLGPAVTGALMASMLVAALIGQFSTRRYTPWIYWLTVVLISIVGTQITDALTDVLGVSLYFSTSIFAALLAVIFLTWWRAEGTLSIHSIYTQRRECFYWAAILCTFALGTAAGDLATDALGMGFTLGVICFAVLIGWIGASYAFGADPVFCFWGAYILTRPLGASIGDLLSQSSEYGGLGLGTLYTSLSFLIVIIGLVLIVSFGDETADAQRK